MTLPTQIVSPTEWREAQEALLVTEKQAAQGRDAPASERRRMRMVEVGSDHGFAGPDGDRRLFLDLTPFRRQEDWEDTPRGRPQTSPYECWRRDDESDQADHQATTMGEGSR